MALRRGINSDSVIHVCKEAGLFLLLADIMSSAEDCVKESLLPEDPAAAIRYFLSFISETLRH